MPAEVKGRIYTDTDIRWHCAGPGDFSVGEHLPAIFTICRWKGDILREEKNSIKDTLKAIQTKNIVCIFVFVYVFETMEK